MTTIEAEYRSTVLAAVKEAAAYSAFSYSGDPAHGKAIYERAEAIADIVINRLIAHYSHTRKAKSQRKV